MNAVTSVVLPSIPESRLASNVLPVPVLLQFCAELERRRGKLDAQTLAWQLAEFYRAIGDHTRAAREYDECASLGRTLAARLAALMRGDPSEAPSPDDGVAPAPFILVNDFLPVARIAEVRAAIEARRGRVEAARIGRANGRVDSSIRTAWRMNGGGVIREMVLPDVIAAMEELGVVNRLRIPPFSVAKIELEIIAYRSGGQYKPHRDNSDGRNGRRLTFLWFLHDEPKTFTGGDLLLHDDGQPKDGRQRWFTRIVPCRNSALFFPADRWHEVTPILSSGTELFGGRLVLTAWFHEAMTPDAIPDSD